MAATEREPARGGSCDPTAAAAAAARLPATAETSNCEAAFPKEREREKKKEREREFRAKPSMRLDRGKLSKREKEMTAAI